VEPTATDIAPNPAGLEHLLDFVKRTRGFDFTGYKRSSIERRVAKRMSEVGVKTHDEYVDYLELQQDEYEALFNTILINVTGFFRDPQTWEHLANEILPPLIAARPPGSPLRVWCAACASGEEAYTVAMVLATALGEAEFRDRVKIYATDVDADALDTARHGVYLPRQVEDVPPDALERYFERSDQRFVFRKDLRRSVIFGRNDLVQDAPISRIDLLVCRNALMYFNAETQGRILRRFHFALDDDGVLVLGKSEMLLTHGGLFVPVDLKRRVFRKILSPAKRDGARARAAAAELDLPTSLAESLRESAFDLAAGAQAVIDRDGALVMANDHARRMFGLVPADIGRPIHDLELSYRPLELRPHLDRLDGDGHTAAIDGVRWSTGKGADRVLDVRLAPLSVDGAVVGTSITYVDVTGAHLLTEALERSKRELEAAYEELQSTVEELETTNEELQSTNEELETTNEELQSTVEELETTNEELQSTNEELETMNDELRTRTAELNDVNAFLETILATVGLAVAVLDRRMHVQIWNDQARELWGLTDADVEDHHFLGLDFGLPVEQLKAQLRACVTGESDRVETMLDATNRRGKAFACRVTCLAYGPADLEDRLGVIVLMEPAAA